LSAGTRLYVGLRLSTLVLVHVGLCSVGMIAYKVNAIYELAACKEKLKTFS